MSTNIIDRLNETLAAKAEAALSQLAGLEAQVAETIARSEAEATARIEARLQGILGTVETSLAGFEASLGQMTSEAFGKALQGIGQRLEALSPATTSEPAQGLPEVVEQTPEPIPTYEEIQAEGDSWKDEMDAQDIERPTAAVAAHAIGADVIGYEPDTDEQDVADEPTDVPDTIPTTTDPNGLHIRHDDRPRHRRYEPAHEPEAGMVYHLRDQRRHWHSVRYIS